MDMNLFSRMIVRLLTRNGKVGLGDFGCFSTEIVPAYFSDKGFTINPPYLRVMFTQETLRDDSMAQLYAKSNGIEPSRAELLINAQVAAIRKEVLEKKDFMLPGLGRLRATSSGEIFFVCGEDMELFPSYDSLQPVSLKSLPLAAPIQDAPAEVLQDIRPAEPVPVPQPEESISVLQPEETDAIPQSEELEIEAELDEMSSEEAVQPRPKPHSSWRTFGIVLIVLLIIAVALLAALAVVGRVNPEFVDQWLYTPEQLEILRYKF